MLALVELLRCCTTPVAVTTDTLNILINVLHKAESEGLVDKFLHAELLRVLKENILQSDEAVASRVQ